MGPFPFPFKTTTATASSKMTNNMKRSTATSLVVVMILVSLTVNSVSAQAASGVSSSGPAKYVLNQKEVNDDSNSNSNSNSASLTSFLNRLLETAENGVPKKVSQKTLGFYRFLTSNGHKISHHVSTHPDTSCDYDDPVKIKYCPPLPKAPPHVLDKIKRQNKENESENKNKNKNNNNDDTSESTTSTSTVHVHNISPKELIAKCLDSPDDPDCLRLLQTMEEADASGSVAPRPSPPVAAATTGSPTENSNAAATTTMTTAAASGAVDRTSYTSTMPSGVHEGLATQEPTRDDCYGNMLDGRFCTSEMPSISEEPTVSTPQDEDIPSAPTAFFPSEAPEPLFYNSGAEVTVCLIEVTNVDDSPDAEFGMPISLVASNDETVTFTYSQTWFQGNSIDYIHTVYVVPPMGEQRECARLENVKFGPTNQE